MEYVKIAEERIGVIIGKEGEVKSRIESVLGVKLGVDSSSGVVTIEGTGRDPLAEWKARDMVRAVSLGIDPETALRLKSDEHALTVINLCDIVGRSRKAILRQKARIIGRKGKTRAHISSLTGTAVAVKGKYIAILGRIEDTVLARDAIEALAGGLPHGVVYKALEKKCSEMKKQDNIEMWRAR